VWVEDGTNNISFAYGKLSSLTAHNMTVGMENGNGIFGSTYYYVKGGPPQGTAPAIGTDLKVNNNFSSTTMSFLVQINAPSPDQAQGTAAKPLMLWDMAKIINNLNVDEVWATAKTPIKVLTPWTWVQALIKP
jgi:hypothetical protein